MLPTFFIVGAAKSGTTSLASYLSQHPQVYFSANKEPNFFVFDGEDLRTRPGPASSEILFSLLYQWCITERAAYENLFAPSRAGQARGEASVRYLYYPEAAGRIASAVPDAKIVIILRHPVDRLWSHYLMMKTQYHLEPEGIFRAVELESSRRTAGWDYDWHYVAAGQYAAQVRRFFDRFGTENVKVFLFEDLVAQPAAMMRDLFSFVGVDPEFPVDLSGKGKVGYGLRIAWIDKLLFYPHPFQPRLRALLANRLGRRLENLALTRNRVGLPRLAESDRRALRRHFADDITQLEKLLHRKLSW